jgi:hypothetical protein
MHRVSAGRLSGLCQFELDAAVYTTGVTLCKPYPLCEHSMTWFPAWHSVQAVAMPALPGIKNQAKPGRPLSNPV